MVIQNLKKKRRGGGRACRSPHSNAARIPQGRKSWARSRDLGGKPGNLSSIPRTFPKTRSLEPSQNPFQSTPHSLLPAPHTCLAYSLLYGSPFSSKGKQTKAWGFLRALVNLWSVRVMDRKRGLFTQGCQFCLCSLSF